MKCANFFLVADAVLDSSKGFLGDRADCETYAGEIEPLINLHHAYARLIIATMKRSCGCACCLEAGAQIEKRIGEQFGQLTDSRGRTLSAAVVFGIFEGGSDPTWLRISRCKGRH